MSGLLVRRSLFGMNGWRPLFSCFFLVALLVLGGVLSFTGLVDAASGPNQATLSVFSPVHGSGNIVEPGLAVGSQFVVDVVALNTGGLNAFDVIVDYDPAILAASASAFAGPGCSGCLFDLPGRTLLLLREKLNDPPGIFRLAVVVLGEPFTESSGTLLRVTLTVRDTGFTPLNIREDLTLLALAGSSVSYAAMDGSFDNRPVPVRPVSIDVRPGSSVNMVNVEARGLLPVAVLTTDGFDAAQVDPLSVRFGRTGSEASPAFVAPVLRDVDGDQDLDRVFNFWVQETGLRAGDSQARLTGRTVGGELFAGVDFVRAVFPGDVNGDLAVDVLDLALVGASFGSVEGGPGWNPFADFDGNGIIDVVDLAVVGSNFGRHG